VTEPEPVPPFDETVIQEPLPDALQLLWQPEGLAVTVTEREAASAVG
jgi:hypothetical protein